MFFIRADQVEEEAKEEEEEEGEGEGEGEEEEEEEGEGEEDLEEGTMLQETEQKPKVTKQKSKEAEQEEDSDEETEGPPAVNVGLLNVRSIKRDQRKRLRIKEIITDKELDVFLTTETWLVNNTADEALREASPPNFTFYHKCRMGQTGGGVAIQFSPELRGQRIYFPSRASFEYVAAALKHKNWYEEVLFISVYRPPGSKSAEFKDFILDFDLLLDMASSDYNRIIVAGDFNIHVEKTRTLRTSLFDKSYIIDFEQHVEDPTHESGGILDLVLSKNVKVSDVRVRDDEISDHKTIYFRVRPTLPG
ncbi:hypothetical protein PO909_026786 [Leuciscus waleckii]